MEKFTTLAGYGGETPPEFQPHFVYVLKCRDGKLYTGCTKDLAVRLSRYMKE